MRIALACLLALAASVPAVAEEPPAWRGLRADIKSSDAVLRVRIGGRKATTPKETQISGVVERVFKGEGTKPGEEISLQQDTAAWQDRLAGELDCPGGLTADGIRFFGNVPAAGSSCVVLARRVEEKWVLDECCLVEPTGGLSFTSAEQAKAYGEERRRAAALADALVERLVAIAGASDADAAVEYTVALCGYFVPEGTGDAELAVGAVLDDWRRVAKALPAENVKVTEALAKAVDGWLVEDGPTTNAARNLEHWLLGRLPESERKRLMPRLVADYKTARRKAEDLQKRLRDPKKHEGKGELDTEAREMMTVPAALAASHERLVRALDPANPPQDLSADELVEMAEKFVGSEKK
ncbi:MAG: hypothetical protein K8T20_03565 [Planctomycetes bacterium]|nr:hypothetical protein [Planctomycetota bacterium]